MASQPPMPNYLTAVSWALHILQYLEHWKIHFSCLLWYCTLTIVPYVMPKSIHQTASVIHTALVWWNNIAASLLVPPFFNALKLFTTCVFSKAFHIFLSYLFTYHTAQSASSLSLLSVLMLSITKPYNFGQGHASCYPCASGTSWGSLSLEYQLCLSYHCQKCWHMVSTLFNQPIQVIVFLDGSLQ